MKAQEIAPLGNEFIRKVRIVTQETQPRILTRQEFHALSEHAAAPCISLMMPTHRRGREQQQDQIRLKNLVTQTSQALREQGCRTPDAESLVEPIQELLHDDPFWEQRSDGLAIFRSPEMFSPYRLPLTFKEQASVGNHFVIKPLLPLLHSGGRFFLLALSQDSATLFEATRDSIRKVELPEIAVAVDNDRDKTLQYHSYRNGVNGKSDAAIFHGHGAAGDRTKTEVASFFQRVNRAVTQALAGEDAPLVLACVGYLAPIYEKTNSYANLLKEKVPGSPKMWTNDELRLHAWNLAESHFARNKQASLDAIQQAVATGGAVTEIRDVVVAAQQGRIAQLLLVDDEQQWGRIDSQHDAVHLTNHQNGDVELLNRAATQTLNHGGTVFVVENIPGVSSALAGLTRY